MKIQAKRITQIVRGAPTMLLEFAECALRGQAMPGESLFAQCRQWLRIQRLWSFLSPNHSKVDAD